VQCTFEDKTLTQKGPEHFVHLYTFHGLTIHPSFIVTSSATIIFTLA